MLRYLANQEGESGIGLEIVQNIGHQYD